MTFAMRWNVQVFRPGKSLEGPFRMHSAEAQTLQVTKIGDLSDDSSQKSLSCVNTLNDTSKSKTKTTWKKTFGLKLIRESIWRKKSKKYANSRTTSCFSNAKPEPKRRLKSIEP